MKCPGWLARGAFRGAVAGLLAWWGLADAQSGERVKLTLEEGIHLALEKDETLLIAQTDLQKSRQQLRRVRADIFPQFSASMSYGRNWLLPTSIFGAAGRQQEVTVGREHSLNGVLSMRQPLLGSGWGAQVKSARLFVGYATEVERQARQELTGEVEKRFYGLLLAQELVGISGQTLDRVTANLERTQSLRRAGRVSDYEVLRTQVQLAALQSDSIRVRNELSLAAIALRDAVRLEGDLEAQGEFLEESRLDLASLDNLLELGRARRPEMRQVERQLGMQEYALRLKQGQGRPVVDLFASGQMAFQSSRLDLYREEAWGRSWVSGLSVVLPLEGIRAGAELDQARLDVERAQLEKALVEREIRLEIHQAWTGAQDAGKRVAAQRRVIEGAERNLWFAESRYFSGVGTQLEVLDAQLTLMEAQTGYAIARHDQTLALVELERAVGVLGEPVEGALKRAAGAPGKPVDAK